MNQMKCLYEEGFKHQSKTHVANGEICISRIGAFSEYPPRLGKEI